MPGVIAAAGSAWSYGGSILTFVFPELLFLAVAGALYVLYTKPHLVPGHRYQLQLRPTTATATPETATAERQTLPTAVDPETITGLVPPEDEG